MALTLNGDGTISSNLADLENVADAAASSDDVLVYDGTAWTPTQLDIAADVKTTLNATGDAPVYACRAWVNFNGTGTVAIRASGNVSSITDNGTGDYTITFTIPMPDNNYVLVGAVAAVASGASSAGVRLTGTFTVNTAQFDIFAGGVKANSSECHLAVFI